MKQVELLDEIAALFQNGDREDALELIDAYLTAHQDEPYARLLKAEMCLELDVQSGFVGQVMTELEPLIRSDTFKRLQIKIDSHVSRKISEGRDKLHRNPSGAVSCFEAACALAPCDPAVPLAIAQSLINHTSETESETGNSLVMQLSQLWFDRQEQAEDEVDESDEQDTTSLLERFLYLALMRSSPDDHVYKQADRLLARCWLDRGQLARVIDWLEHPTRNQATASDIQELLNGRMMDDIQTIAITLMCAGEFESADDIVSQWTLDLPATPALRLWQAELLRLRGQTIEAIAAYEYTLETFDPAPGVSYKNVYDFWMKAQDMRITCQQCSKANRALELNCVLCDGSLRKHELLSKIYNTRNAPPSAIAHIGLAELLPEARQTERIHHMCAALEELAADDRSGRNTIQNEITRLSVSERAATIPDTAILNVVKQQQITPESLSELRSIEPAIWVTVPLQTRLAMVRRLLKANALVEVRDLARIIFAEKSTLPSVHTVLTKIEEAVNTRAAELMNGAQSALKCGHTNQAVQFAGDVLAMCPHNIDARLLRGEAHFQTGNYPDALGDFQQVIVSSSNPMIIRAAQLTAVKAMERLGQIADALVTLEGIPGDEARQLRERLERRQRNEPFIAVERADDIVMVDTLSSTPGTPHYRGYFAVAVREVGRPWKVSPDAWRDKVLSVGYTFIEVLGGLRNTCGDPIFALRLISQPNSHIPERGRLTLALVVRVIADREKDCRNTAHDVWRALRDILPGTQEHVYSIEPIVDPDELAYVREPFPVASAAEIVRREDIPTRTGESYAVYPFTVGNLDLHNLCWTLLRQNAPAMVSIHLLPTSLMAWEQGALNGMMLDDTRQKIAPMTEPDVQHLDDPVTHWWRHAPRMGRAQANRFLLDNLRVRAYTLAVNVVGSEETALLPERVASVMFGSAGSANGAFCGSYEIVRAITSSEQAIARRNLTDVDLERWVFSAAPDGAPRLRQLVSEYEAAVAFRLPIPGYDGLPGMKAVDIRPVAPPSDLAENGIQLGESVIRVSGVALPITQANDDRRRHTYIVGRTGTGKSNLIKNLALQDIEDGDGVCVVDPHGDLIDDLLRRIPPHRVHDVILFDPADEDRPIGLNLLDHRNETEKHLIVNEFIAMLMRMYDPGQTGIVGPRFQHNVRNAMLTAMSVEGSTLIEVVRVLSNKNYVRKLLPSVTDPLVRSYWLDQIDNTSDFHKSEILDYIVSKFNPFVGDRRVRHIVGQRKTTIDFRRVMDERKILLVNLCKGKIGAENAQFLGLLLVQRLLMTALSRADVPEDRRPDFMLYVDEFQNFATKTFSTILSEGRKYGVAATVANQYLTQLDPPIREAIFGNVGTIVNFRLGINDATMLTPEMYPTFSGDDLINLPKYTTCVKLLVNGLAARPFTMRTMLDMRVPDNEQANAIRKTSRQIYGRDANSVQEDISARYVS